jgi:hypothetical protein
MTAQEVEQFVARVFIELGAKKDFDISDTLFIDGDRCLAIAYRVENLRPSGASRTKPLSSTTATASYCGP